MGDVLTDETTTFLVHRVYVGSATQTVASLASEPALATSGYQVVDQSWQPVRRAWEWWP